MMQVQEECWGDVVCMFLQTKMVFFHTYVPRTSCIIECAWYGKIGQSSFKNRESPTFEAKNVILHTCLNNNKQGDQNISCFKSGRRLIIISM